MIDAKNKDYTKNEGKQSGELGEGGREGELGIFRGGRLCISTAASPSTCSFANENT